MGRRAHVETSTWEDAHMGRRLHGETVTWGDGQMGSWAHGEMDTGEDGHMGIHGEMGTVEDGHMARWAQVVDSINSKGAWTHGVKKNYVSELYNCTCNYCSNRTVW